MANQQYKKTHVTDDEEYEEEVIERDEYEDAPYDPSYDEDDEDEYNEEEVEEYDDDYDDEEYEDEEYEDEEYEDEYDDEPEEYYEDEEPADDSKIQQVLAELSEIKRSMGTPAPQAQPFHAAPVAGGAPLIFAHQPPAPIVQPNNDIAMYNEISKLRNDLVKTQSSQEMHAEVARLKDSLERENRHNESGLLNEIRRLQDRVDDLSSNKNNNNNNGGDSVRQYRGVSGGGVCNCNCDDTIRREVGKLLDINESILKAMDEGDKRLSVQMDIVKKKVNQLPNFNELRQDIAGLKDNLENAKAADPRLVEELKAIRLAGGTSVDPRVLEEIKELKGLIARGGVTSTASTSSGGGCNFDANKVIERLASVSGSAATVDNTELMRQIFEIKVLVGSQNPVVGLRNKSVLELFNEFNQLKVDVGYKQTLGEKLKMVDEFGKKLANSTDQEALEIHKALAGLSKELQEEKLNKKALVSLAEFINSSDVTVSANKVKAAENYAASYDNLKHARPDDIVGSLGTVLEDINILQDYNRARENDAIYNQILDLAEQYNATPTEKLANEIKQRAEALYAVSVVDYVNFTPQAPKRTRVVPMPESVALAEKIDDIREVVAVGAPLLNENYDEAAEGDDEISLTGEPNANTATSASMARVLQELARVERDLGSLVSQGALASQVDELHNISADIFDQLNTVILAQEELLASSTTTAERDANVAAIVETLSADINEVKEKIMEQERFINELADIKAEIAALNRVNSSVVANENDDIIVDEAASTTTVVSENLEAQLNSVCDKLAAEIESCNTGVVEQVKAMGDTLSESIAAIDENIVMLQDLGLQIAGDVTHLKEAKIDELTAQIATDVAEIKKQLADMAVIGTNTMPVDTGHSEELEKKIAELKMLAEEKDDHTLEQSEAIQDQLNVLLDQVAALKDDLPTQDMPSAEAMIQGEGVDLMLNDISEKLHTLLYDADSDPDNSNNIQLIIADISAIVADVGEIKEKVYSADENILAALANLAENVAALQGVSVGSTVPKTDEQLAQLEEQTSESAATALADLSELKERLVELCERAPTDLEEVKEAFYATRTRDMAEISMELEKVLGEIKQLKQDVSQLGEIRREITGYRDDVKTNEIEINETVVGDVELIVQELGELKDQFAVVREELKALENTPTKDDVNYLVNEVVSLRDDIQAQKDDAIKRTRDGDALTRIKTADKVEENETLNILVDEMLAVRNVVDSCSEAATAQSSDIEYVKAGIEELKTSFIQEVEQIKANQDACLVEQNEALAAQNAQLTEELGYIKEMLAQLVAAKEEEKAAAESQKETQAIFSDDIVAQQNDEANQEPTMMAAATADYSEIMVELAEVKEEIASLNDLLVARANNELAAKEQEEAVIYDENGEPIVSDTTTATNDATNEVLNALIEEISALREQMLAQAESAEATAEAAAAAPDAHADTLAALFDEVSALRNELAEQRDATANSEVYADEIQATDAIPRTNSSEELLNALFDEITALRQEMLELREVNVTSQETTETVVASDVIPKTNTNTQILSELCDQIESLRLDLAEQKDLRAQELEAQAIEKQEAQAAALQTEQVQDAMPVTSANAELLSALLDEVSALREEVNAKGSTAFSGTTEQRLSPDSLAVVLDEINALKDAIDTLKDTSQTIGADPTFGATQVANTDLLSLVLDEIHVLKEQVATQAEASANQTQTEADSALLDEITALRMEVNSIQIQAPDADVMSSIAELSDKFTGLEATVKALTEEPDRSVITEILALRDEFQAFKDAYSASEVSEDGVVSTTTNKDLSTQILSVETQVQILAEELASYRGRISEDETLEDTLIKDDAVLAEVQSLREEIAALKEISAIDAIMAEVQGLRDQFFAINMAQVEGGDSNYESYNNIILDELSSLRSELETIKGSNSNEDLAELKKSVEKSIAKINQEIAENLSNFATSEQLIVLAGAVDNINEQAEKIDKLQKDLSANLEANEALVNYMSGVSDLVERQNRQIDSISGLSVKNMENLRQEIAASVSESAKSDNYSAALAVKEIAKLKEEIVKENSSKKDNEKVLKEIRSVKDEIEVMLNSNKSKSTKATKTVVENEDDDLSTMTNNLKRELNDIADFVAQTQKEDEEEKATNTAIAKKANTAKKGTGSKSSGASVAKKSTGSKSSGTPTAKKGTTTTASSSKSTGKKVTGGSSSKKASSTKEDASSQAKNFYIQTESEQDYGNSLPGISIINESANQSNKKAISKKSTKQTNSKSVFKQQEEQSELSQIDSIADELLSKIDKESLEIAFRMQTDDSVEEGGASSRTRDDLDMAARLAKQVANKLIMEQLVQQLGDGAVPQSKVEEIVKEILPQEFTTIQMSEQSDSVRRLANSLVLDKLRARLTDRNTKDRL